MSLETRLWSASDQLRANSELKASEYAAPVLGLIFLKYADYKFNKAQEQLEKKSSSGRRQIGKEDYHALGAIYLPEGSRFNELLELPEGQDTAKAINDAMKAIEKDNPDLKDVLPKNYNTIDNNTLIELLKIMSSIPDIEGDAFGKIYEYFLGNFAMSEGRRGGEFYTPTPLVKLIVEIIEPFRGRILDPACGSGGMFVQSFKFVENQRNNGTGLSIYGQERVKDTVRLCKMNLAVHGLAGDIRQGNTYYEDLHNTTGRFDYVMANPPFNVDGVDKERIKDDPRYPIGMPNVDNANYLWIQLFYSSLTENGRAGFVMANSASDARHSEMEIRKKIIEDYAVDVIVAIGPKFFYTLPISCTLWFLDKAKKDTERKDKVLFIDARQIFTIIDRAHREFTPQQIEFIANIVRAYRGEELENKHNSEELLKEHFPDGKIHDRPGLCKVASIQEIKNEGWSLNPGRYVGVTEVDEDEFDFKERLQELNDELEILNSKSHELEEKISDNINKILG
ncbi:MAG: SAM-dependent DNA methyltransferase [Thermoplasmata archaeon]|nr:MAG: SAM-dependent DNA methyltransferase [Thermoplasmata archaeon]